MTYDLPARERYHLALGQFAAKFAEVEQATFDFLVWSAGIDPRIAPAIFSGVRVDNAAKMVTRIHQAMGTTPHPAMTAAFERLYRINQLRNEILHHGADPDQSSPGDWVVTANRKALRPDLVQEMKITPSILDELTSDLDVIAMILELVPILAMEHNDVANKTFLRTVVEWGAMPQMMQQSRS